MPSPPYGFRFTVAAARSGFRLDAAVAAEVETCSRSFAAALIRRGLITVDGLGKKPGYVLRAGETVSGTLPQPEAPDFRPEKIPLHILYEDAELVVIDKPPGMVVHPSPGHSGGTLVNALMHHCPDLAGISGSLRPGIVHRLDKDTSGVLVAAKNGMAMQHLAAQFKSRQVRKRYLALVYGVPASDFGTVDLPIGRHPVDRKKMSVTTRAPRSALTHWKVRESFVGAALLEVDIRTGRTHQIRVHCHAMGHPVIGDPVYFGRGEKKRLASVAPRMAQGVRDATRQMLHAWKLSFLHPKTGKTLTLEAPIPADMRSLIAEFRKWTPGREFDSR